MAGLLTIDIIDPGVTTSKMIQTDIVAKIECFENEVHGKERRCNWFRCLRQMRLECSYRQTIPPLQTAVALFSENLPRRQSRRTLFWKHRWRCKGGLCKVAGWRPPASHRRKVRSIDCRADCAPVPRGLRENTQTNEHVLYLPQFTFSLRARQGG